MLRERAEGISYASILRDLKRRVNPEKLGVTVQGIRETLSKDLLVELKCPKECRGLLDSAFQEAIEVRGTVRHLIPRFEVEITDLHPSIEGEEVEEAVREFCQQGPEMELRVSLTKRPYRGIRKAYVLLKETRTLKLCKASHIRIGWVSCGVRRKIETNSCYRCLGFGMAADCRGPDRSRDCWRCGEEGHTSSKL